MLNRYKNTQVKIFLPYIADTKDDKFILKEYL